MGALGTLYNAAIAAADKLQDSDHMQVWALVLVVSLLLLCIILGHLLEESRFFNEANVAILLVSATFLHFPATVMDF